MIRQIFPLLTDRISYPYNKKIKISEDSIMKAIHFLLSGALVCSMLILGGCGQTATDNDQIEPVADQTQTSDTQQDDTTQAGVLNSFSATDLDGNTIDQSMLADYDLTMVNVWATFCGPCIKEMPDLGALSQEYQDKGVQIIGLVSDVLNSDGTINEEQVQTARDIVSETGAAYTHLLPSEDLYGVLSQIQYVPTTFFVDSTGAQVGSAVISAQSKDKWIETIDAMLAEVQG